MTERSNKGWKWLIFAIIFALIGAHTYHILGKKAEIIEIEKTDTIQICDTAYIQQPAEVITIYKQVPKYITEVKTDTIKENTILVTETKTYIDSICTKDNDSIFLKNIIQGVNANLLSTEVTLKKQDKIITNTITIEKLVKNNKRISIGLQGGYGYAFKSKELTPYVGIGINIKI